MQLEMFDALDAEVAIVKAAEDAQEESRLAALVASFNQPVQCPDCGEIAKNDCLLRNNHAMYFNGMCQKHFSHNSWAQWGSPRQAESLAWLAAHGFTLDARVAL